MSVYARPKPTRTMRMRQKERQTDRQRHRERERERWTEWKGSHISLLLSSEVCRFGSFSERWFGCQSIAVGRLNACRVQLPRYRWRQDEMVRWTAMYPAAAAAAPPPTLFFTVHYRNWPYPCPDFINSGAKQSVSGLQKRRLACMDAEYSIALAAVARPEAQKTPWTWQAVEKRRQPAQWVIER